MKHNEQMNKTQTHAHTHKISTEQNVTRRDASHKLESIFVENNKRFIDRSSYRIRRHQK